MLSLPMLNWLMMELTKLSRDRQLEQDASLPQIDRELSTTKTTSALANSHGTYADVVTVFDTIVYQKKNSNVQLYEGYV